MNGVLFLLLLPYTYTYHRWQDVVRSVTIVCLLQSWRIAPSCRLFHRCSNILSSSFDVEVFNLRVWPASYSRMTLVAGAVPYLRRFPFLLFFAGITLIFLSGVNTHRGRPPMDSAAVLGTEKVYLPQGSPSFGPVLGSGRSYTTSVPRSRVVTIGQYRT